MDTRDTPEQAELRRSARQLAGTLAARTVTELENAVRASRLGDAVRDAGWLELRDDRGQGEPLAGGVEAAIVADALGASAADVAFAGPVLARDLFRRAGAPDADGGVMALSSELREVAVVVGVATTTPIYAVDADDGDAASVLVPEGSGFRLARLQIPPGPAGTGSDLTRRVRVIPPGTAVVPLTEQPRQVSHDDLAGWTALGLALTSADLVGVMRGVTDITVAYAAARRQYGVPVGSFQAVQHLLADACCLAEGSLSLSLHASWAVDNLAPDEAVAAGRVAKVYCTRARTVCETAVQVHGGIGNTWECMVHVFLRRALLSSQWFGDDADQLRALQHDRLGATVGLS